MTKKQKKKAMELLIENSEKLLINNVVNIPLNNYNEINLVTIKYNLLSLIDDIDELEKLKEEYNKDFPKKEFNYDDIPF